MRLGLLDFGTDLRSTILCAREADALGYSRYWLGEHHHVDDAWASAEIVVSLVAAFTKRIRVGTAGTLLSHHNPLKVACDFALLSGAFDGRIDLGLARGAPTNAANARLLNGGGFDGDYESRVKLIIELFNDLGHVGDGQQAVIIPKVSSNPEIWILGSSDRSIKIAADYALSYCHALFLESTNPERSGVARQNFGRVRNACIAVSMVCAEEESRIDQITRDPRVSVALTIYGTPAECVRKCEALANESQCDEVIVLDLAASIDHRLNTIRSLARALGR